MGLDRSLESRMLVSDFDFDLPEGLIAQTPVEPRDAARLLTLNRRTGAMSHRVFAELPELLRSGDCLVANDSRVIPARLIGHKQTGGAVELLLLRRTSLRRWHALVRPGRRLHVGARMLFGEDDELSALVVAESPAGQREVEFTWAGGAFENVLERLGQMPLPPYITAKLADPSRYQTVYCRELGSAAAPTAGLHFTSALLARLNQAGIRVVFVTLHVGLGTFRPVQAEEIEQHQMHTEYYAITPEVADAVNQTRAAGGRVIAVGTTSARTLETQATESGQVVAGAGATSIFIYPSYRFKAIDGLITNFHLPRSTLLMLVSAFAGVSSTRQAYQEAIRLRYRFFSFGDAMLIL